MNPEKRLEPQRAELLSHLVYWTNKWEGLKRTQDEMVADGRALDVNFRDPIFARMKMLAVQAQIDEIDRAWGWLEKPVAGVDAGSV
jgi:hypothetical protein